MKIKFASSPRIPESDKVALAVFLYLTSFSSLFRVFFICRCRMTYNQYDVKLCTDLKHVIYRTGGPCRSGEMLPKVLSVRTDRGRRKRLRSVHAVKTGGNISKFLARLLEGSITWENTEERFNLQMLDWPPTSRWSDHCWKTVHQCRVVFHLTSQMN